MRINKSSDRTTLPLASDRATLLLNTFVNAQFWRVSSAERANCSLDLRSSIQAKGNGHQAYHVHIFRNVNKIGTRDRNSHIGRVRCMGVVLGGGGGGGGGVERGGGGLGVLQRPRPYPRQRPAGCGSFTFEGLSTYWIHRIHRHQATRQCIVSITRCRLCVHRYPSFRSAKSQRHYSVETHVTSLPTCRRTHVSMSEENKRASTAFNSAIRSNYSFRSAGNYDGWCANYFCKKRDASAIVIGWIAIGWIAKNVHILSCRCHWGWSAVFLLLDGIRADVPSTASDKLSVMTHVRTFYVTSRARLYLTDFQRDSGASA